MMPLHGATPPRYPSLPPEEAAPSLPDRPPSRPAPLPSEGRPPGTPDAEGRGNLQFNHPDTGNLQVLADAALMPPPRPPSAGPSAHAGHESQPPLQSQPDSWFRPQSPTYTALKLDSEIERDFGFTLAHPFPSGTKEMDLEQAAATEMFRNNMNAFDPTGILRSNGEFGQTFRAEGGGVTANNPIHFMFGGSMFMPPGSYTAETSQAIHSHPDNPAHKNDYPSNADYFAAYVSSQGNTGRLKGEMFYHPGSDKFFGYEPRLNPATGMPEFHEYVNPFDMGKPPGNFEYNRPLPDPGSYGHHFINWPEENPGMANPGIANPGP
ncbi:MAG: hypothetical protein JWP91_2158 [Fibrobacteres bacterium]|nr:hypothetical protein [Fibrobacterota bacterium]